MIIRIPRGVKDVLPDQVYKWHYIESNIRNICGVFGYNEIRTPVFEHTELFQRGVGGNTDIVQKEMYTFNDRSGRSITLKPEGTAGVVRSFIENSLYAGVQPTKMFYLTPVFRYEKPQAGRLREHHQFGVEVFGSDKPSVDAEVIDIAMTLFSGLGIKNLHMNINSIGCPECRKEYNQELKTYLKDNLDKLCMDCKDRIERNPLRILDCKKIPCGDIVNKAPVMLDYLCSGCSSHFDKLQEHLKNLGYQYHVNPFIVRGLDYYTKTVFEIISNDIGAQGTICGGGRYDGLVEECGGPPTPGVGFGMGLERLILTMENQGIKIPEPKKLQVFIVSIGDMADMEASKLLSNLRIQGLSADKDHLSRSMKAQMKYADKAGTEYTVIIGEDELKTGCACVKNMDTGVQEKIELNKLSEYIKENTGRK